MQVDYQSIKIFKIDILQSAEVKMPPVATLILLAKPKAGTEFRLTVEVGMPYCIGGPPNEWACPSALHPLYSRLIDTQGMNPFHALCLTISLLQQLLQAYLDDGGTLKTEDGADFTLEGYAFGVAVHPTARE